MDANALPTPRRRSKRVQSTSKQSTNDDSSDNIVTPDIVQSNKRHKHMKGSTTKDTTSIKVEVVKSAIVKNAKMKVKRPSPAESYYVTAALSKLHPEIVDRNDERRKKAHQSCGSQDTITDSIMHTMLSQNTTDANKDRAWASLKRKFPTWDQVESCENLDEIESAIKVAGLAKTRAQRMQNILRQVKQERGEASLEYIRDFDDDKVKKELSRFKGLGPKTISCVLLFSLGRNEFPVDTHVLRITQKMGWISSGTNREQAYEYLNDNIPNEIKMDLHCLLVRHGKVCHKCAANGRPQFPPEDGSQLDCPLLKVSSWKGSVPGAFVVHLAKAYGDNTSSSAVAIKSEIVPDLPKSK
ncbi:unnamed protein product [Cylindrotheca closterium]|uniref:HhH-GPD domain-containing protein n=1 Tax=Cylindrotheca closterium TaxID=2856 RepID=A0AAD2FQP4_9STRA|nr:unnamed protein product [Cylindrotheca closterium]